MYLDPQTFGIQNVYTELDTCVQPRFIHVKIRDTGIAPLTIRKDYDIDLRQYFDQKKIDMIQGVIVRYWWVNDIFVPNVPANKVNSYLTSMELDNGYSTSLDYNANTSAVGLELHRPLLCSESTNIKFIATAYSEAEPMESVFADIYFTNFRVRPFNSHIPEIQPGA